MTEPGFHVELLDGSQGARLKGELDLGSYEKADVAIRPLFEASGTIVMDCADLTFVDSSGIRLFIRLRKALEDRGEVVLRAPQPHIRRVLEIAGLPQLGIKLEDGPA